MLVIEVTKSAIMLDSHAARSILIQLHTMSILPSAKMRWFDPDIGGLTLQSSPSAFASEKSGAGPINSPVFTSIIPFIPLPCTRPSKSQPGIKLVRFYIFLYGF